MKFNAVRLRDWSRRRHDLHDDSLVRVRLNAGDVHEWNHDVVRPNPARDGKQPVKELLPVLALLGTTPQERKVHEPVGANSRCRDPMFFLERVELLQPRIAKDRVHIETIGIDDPLDIVDAGSHRIRKLIAPPRARERLKATRVRRHQPALHDAELGRRRRGGLRETHSGNCAMIIFSENSSRLRNGQRSSRGFETNEPSGRCVEDRRG